MEANEATNEGTREFFQSKHVPWLKSYLHDREIQTSSDEKNPKEKQNLWSFLLMQAR
jgi:hypothetical protein